MNAARERILARLRAAETPAVAELERPVERLEWSARERLARFTGRMQAVRGEVHCVARSGWPALLRELAAAKGVQTLLYAPETEHGRLLADGHAGAPRLQPYAEPVEAWKDRLFAEVDAAVTATRGAIAETGSLILWPDAKEPRLMSLVPPLHFALLDAGALYSTFAEAVEAQGWATGMPTNALLVSGPSKSADIEQTLAYGVHGPKELVVLVLGDA